MAFLFGLAWVCWKWAKFGNLMDTISGNGQHRIGPLLVTMLPAICAFDLAAFFSILFIINQRRSKQC